MRSILNLGEQCPCEERSNKEREKVGGRLGWAGGEQTARGEEAICRLYHFVLVFLELFVGELVQIKILIVHLFVFFV